VSDAPLAREWRLYVEDMAAFCDKVSVYAQGLDRGSFAADAMRYEALTRLLAARP
jgi:uncharacterized protein with HEPN domain